MSNSIFFSALFSFNTASNSFPALDLKPLIFAVLPFVNKATNCESLRVFPPTVRHSFKQPSFEQNTPFSFTLTEDLLQQGQFRAGKSFKAGFVILQVG